MLNVEAGKGYNQAQNGDPDVILSVSQQIVNNGGVGENSGALNVPNSNIRRSIEEKRRQVEYLEYEMKRSLVCAMKLFWDHLKNQFDGNEIKVEELVRILEQAIAESYNEWDLRVKLEEYIWEQPGKRDDRDYEKWALGLLGKKPFASLTYDSLDLGGVRDVSGEHVLKPYFEAKAKLMKENRDLN